MNIKTTITLIIGIIIGITLTKLISPANQTKALAKTTTPSTIQKQTAKVATHFKLKIDSLIATTVQLSGKLNNSKFALASVKNKSLVLQTQLQATFNTYQISGDTATKETARTVLQNKVLTLMQQTNAKDSIYENIDSTRVLQLQTKDATISLKDSMYQALNLSFTESMLQQQLLYNQNKLLNRQFKKQRIKSKLISAGLLILSAATASYLITH